MLRFPAVCLIATVLVVAATATRSPAVAANPYVMQVDMHGPQVVPPVDSIGWGFVRFFFTQDRQSADYTVDVKGFSGNIVLGADIRRGPAGTNGPIIHHLADGGFITMGSHISFSRAELDDMATGLWYVTLYTALHPNGEMRGQVVLPADFRGTPVPAPVILTPQEPGSAPNLASEPEARPILPVTTAPAAAQAPPPDAIPLASIVISPPNTGDGGMRDNPEP
jgi:CHRD domain-containing protein